MRRSAPASASAMPRHRGRAERRGARGDRPHRATVLAASQTISPASRSSSRRGRLQPRRLRNRPRHHPRRDHRPYGGIAEAARRRTAVAQCQSGAKTQPMLVVVPCHRVMAAGNKPGGFSRQWRRGDEAEDARDRRRAGEPHAEFVLINSASPPLDGEGRCACSEAECAAGR